MFLLAALTLAARRAREYNGMPKCRITFPDGTGFEFGVADLSTPKLTRTIYDTTRHHDSDGVYAVGTLRRRSPISITPATQFIHFEERP